MCVRRSRGSGGVDMDLDPFGYDDGADQCLDGYVSRLGFKLQFAEVLVPH